MKRVDFIKSLAALPLTAVAFQGEEVGKKVEIGTHAKYIVFLNADAVDHHDFCRNHDSLPDGTPVFAVPGWIPLDDVVRIYKLEQ